MGVHFGVRTASGDGRQPVAPSMNEASRLRAEATTKAEWPAKARALQETRFSPLAMRRFFTCGLDVMRPPKLVAYRAPTVPVLKLSRQVQVGPAGPGLPKLPSNHRVCRPEMIGVTLWTNGTVRCTHSSKEVSLVHPGPRGEEVHLRLKGKPEGALQRKDKANKTKP